MKIIGLLIAGLSLTGCANSLYEGRYSWDDGWRQGSITETGVGLDFQKGLAKNCNATLPADQRFAIVRLGTVRGFWRTVPIPSDASWKKNDALYINVLDCKAPLMPRSK